MVAQCLVVDWCTNNCRVAQLVVSHLISSHPSVARWDEHAGMLVIHDQKCQELSQTVKKLSEKKEKLLVRMRQKKSSLTKVEERLSAQEMELLENKQSLEMMCKDRDQTH